MTESAKRGLLPKTAEISVLTVFRLGMENLAENGARWRESSVLARDLFSQTGSHLGFGLIR